MSTVRLATWSRIYLSCPGLSLLFFWRFVFVFNRELPPPPPPFYTHTHTHTHTHLNKLRLVGDTASQRVSYRELQFLACTLNSFIWSCFRFLWHPPPFFTLSHWLALQTAEYFPLKTKKKKKKQPQQRTGKKKQRWPFFFTVSRVDKYHRSGWTRFWRWTVSPIGVSTRTRNVDDNLQNKRNKNQYANQRATAADTWPATGPVLSKRLEGTGKRKLDGHGRPDLEEPRPPFWETWWSREMTDPTLARRPQWRTLEPAGGGGTQWPETLDGGGG